MATEIDRLGWLCRAWGGKLLVVPEVEFDDLSEAPGFSSAPFTSYDLGVLWNEKLIVTVEGADWFNIIHEMGHVFASPSELGDEFEFFGWEYLLAQRVGDVKQWIAGNKDYGISLADVGFPEKTLGTSKDFEFFTAEEREQILERAVEISTENGCVKNNVPVAIR